MHGLHLERDIDVELWSEAKATLESKTTREVIFQGLNWYLTPMDTTTKNPPSPAGRRKESRRTKINFLVTGLTGTRPPVFDV